MAWLGPAILFALGTVIELKVLASGLLGLVTHAPVGLGMHLVARRREKAIEEWVLDPERLQLLRVSSWRIVPVAPFEDLTGVALASEPTTVFGRRANLQVVYLLQAEREPLAVARFEFLKRERAIAMSEAISRRLELPSWLGEADDKLVIDSDGVSFRKHRYPHDALVFLLTLAWPLLVFGWFF